MTGPGEAASLLPATADCKGTDARDGGGASSATGDPPAGVGTTMGSGTGGGVVCGESETWVWAARGTAEELGEEAAGTCCCVVLVDTAGVLEVEEVVARVEEVVVCSGGGGGGGGSGGGGWAARGGVSGDGGAGGGGGCSVGWASGVEVEVVVCSAVEVCSWVVDFDSSDLD